MRAAAATGDPRMLTTVRRLSKTQAWKEGNVGNLVSALKLYPGPRVIAFADQALRAYRSPDLGRGDVGQWIWVLAAHGSEGREVLRRLAGDWTLPVAPRVLRLLGVGELRDMTGALKQLYARVLEHYDDVGPTYLREVINQARLRLHAAAVPLLLHAYSHQVASAAKALDALRDYKARLDEFEGWVDARKDQPWVERERTVGFPDRMRDAAENPTWRKALIYAHAAQFGKRAVYQLVSVARGDPDEGVRKVALKALEALALGTARDR